MLKEDMKAAAHTPGPWRVEPDFPHIGKAGVLMSDNTDVGTSDGYESAYLRIEDARLIAAAPDLLAASKRAVRLLDRPEAVGADALLDSTLQQLRAAIAKAEGAP